MKVKEITIRYVVEADVSPSDITNLIDDDMPAWMIDYEHLTESEPREPTREEAAGR